MNFPLMLAVATAVEAGAALVQGVLGFGVNVVAVPFLVIVNPHFAPVPVVIVSAVGSILVLFRERSELSWQTGGFGLIGRLPGTVIGLLIVDAVSHRALVAILGGIICVAVAASLWKPNMRLNAGVTVGAGVASGVFGTVGGVSGMPFALALQRLPGPAFRSTVAGLSLIGGVLSLCGFAILDEIRQSDLILASVLLPGLAIGFCASSLVIVRINEKAKQLRYIVLGVAAAGALSLIIRTFA